MVEEKYIIFANEKRNLILSVSYQFLSGIIVNWFVKLKKVSHEEEFVTDHVVFSIFNSQVFIFGGGKASERYCLMCVGKTLQLLILVSAVEVS